MAGAMTVLSWGGIDFQSGYEMAGQLEYLREAVKWGTDYFIKCYIGPEEIYAQVYELFIIHCIANCTVFLNL